MANTIWTAGLPSKPGVYWFDNGFRTFPDETPMVIKVYGNGRTYGYGDYGSGPVNNFYNPTVCPNAGYAEIAPHGKWLDYTCIKRDGARAWVKDPNGHLGFGLLRPGWNKTAGGSVLWLDHPTSGETHGDWIGDGYLFSPVKVPRLK